MLDIGDWLDMQSISYREIRNKEFWFILQNHWFIYMKQK